MGKEKRPDWWTGLSAVQPDLAQLCRNHAIGVDLIRCSHDSEEMMDRVLAEFEERLEELSNDALDARTGPPSEADRSRLRALAMFSRQVSALMEKSAAVDQLRCWAEEQQRLNLELQRAWSREQASRSRLEKVLQVLDVGILLTHADGKIDHCNGCFANWVGLSPDDIIGQPLARYVGEIARGGSGPVTLTTADQTEMPVEISRRILPDDGDGEVVLLRRIEVDPLLEELTEELEALGKLCHQANNRLTPVLGRAQILALRKDLPEPAARDARSIESSARGIAEAIRELADRVRAMREQTRQRAVERGGVGEG